MYIRMSSAKPTLVELKDALPEVAYKWYDLGLYLGISSGTLNAIKKTNQQVVNDCMNDMLETWLGKKDPDNWDDIVDALRKIDRNDVANRIGKCTIVYHHYIICQSFCMPVLYN